jgi:hypothetical protein
MPGADAKASSRACLTVLHGLSSSDQRRNPRPVKIGRQRPLTVVRRAAHAYQKEPAGWGRKWSRREVAIPISAVTAIDEGIRLNMTKKQLEDLPPSR